MTQNDPERLICEVAELVDMGEPVRDGQAIGKVVIEVYGGVAAVTSKPEHVEVEIIDHDNEEPGALDCFPDRADRHQVSQGRGES